MADYDLGIAYKWIYDIDFVAKIEKTFQKHGLSTYVVHKDNILEVTELLRNKSLYFGTYLDRGSDEDEVFEEAAQLISKENTYIFNHYDYVDEAIDKAVMHKKLEELGMYLPETYIIPPFDVEKEIRITAEQLSSLGIPFLIKPAYYSGGGEGINLNGRTFDDIEITRNENPDDHYLLQKYVKPLEVNEHRCWLRCFWFIDEAVPLWWDDRTHIYRMITQDEYGKFKLGNINRVLETIAKITGMDYFSTEFAINENKEFVLIDYVNDQCDMRLQSKHPTGVPENIVDLFIRKLEYKVREVKKTYHLQ